MSSAAQDLLLDAFSRIRDQVAHLCAEATESEMTYRPDSQANPIAWLIWHSTRIQDDHVSGLAGTEQIWMQDGWYDRFALPFDPGVHGYGMTPEDVGKVQVAPGLLDGYQSAVHQMVVEYVGAVTPEELARVVDAKWDPPVTAAARLVSVLGDCSAHLGQAEYVWGLAQRVRLLH